MNTENHKEFIRESCPVCSNRESNKLFKKNGCEIVKCNYCNLIYQKNPPSLSEMKNIYNEYYSDEEGKVDNSIYVKTENFRVYEAEKWLKKLPKIHDLLDIGCGSGRVFPLFAELNIPEVVGIDISSTAIRKVRPFPNHKAVVMSVEELNFPPDYFDAAISNAVLRLIPHGARITRAISNIAEQCKSVLLREPIRGRESYCEYIHDYEALFQGKMRLEEHYQDGPVDVMIFSK